MLNVLHALKIYARPPPPLMPGGVAQRNLQGPKRCRALRGCRMYSFRVSCYTVQLRFAVFNLLISRRRAGSQVLGSKKACSTAWGCFLAICLPFTGSVFCLNSTKDRAELKVMHLR